MSQSTAANRGGKDEAARSNCMPENSMPRHKNAHGRHELRHRSVELTDRDVREAARLLALISPPPPNVDHTLTVMHNTAPLGRDAILARVRKYLSNRRLRSDYFNASMFGEPGWDILLLLYVSEHAGRRQTIRRLADRINTPVTSAQRWIRYLEKEDLVEREPHPEDQRMMYVTLLDPARAMIEDYFSSIMP